MFAQFSGSTKDRNINLGNVASSSTASVIAKARAERLQRERARAETEAAAAIQRTWRGRKAAEKVKDELLQQVKQGVLVNERAAQALVLVFWQSVRSEPSRRSAPAMAIKDDVLGAWCSESLQKTDGEVATLFITAHDQSVHLLTLARLCVVLLCLTGRDASTSNATKYLTWLEAATDPKPFSRMKDGGEGMRLHLAEYLSTHGYVRCLVEGFKGMPLTARKKHPSTPILFRLLTKFNTLIPSSVTLQNHLVPSIANNLLAIPSLPSSIPLQSLTHLCANLKLFETVFPLLIAHPEMASKDGLATMQGLTYFLGNLCTIVVRGGLLARQTPAGISLWMQVLAIIFASFPARWMSWLESAGRPGDDIEMSSSGPAADTTAPAPSQAVINQAMLLIQPDHLQMLQKSAVRQPRTNMQPFVNLVLAMLESCRGTASWEYIIESLLEGDEGIALLLSLWRDFVRRHWTTSMAKQAWENLYMDGDSLTANQLPALVLLSILYTQHLSTLPDDEFFSSAPTVRKTTLALDDVLDLARIWKDLAFMGYWIGLEPRVVRGAGPAPSEANLREVEKRKEYVRGLFTRALTAVCSRDARRRFAPDNFWIVTGVYNMDNFIEAVCAEETQLEEQEESEEAEGGQNEPASIPSAWVRVRKSITKGQMARISPRLGLLNNLPMTIPFEARVAIFDQFIYNDRKRLGLERYSRRQGMAHQARIRRSHLSADSFSELNKLGPLMKTVIQITFIDQWGQEETGIDGGGLFKELLTSLAKEVFDPSRGLWLTTTGNELWPNPHSYAKEPFQLLWYEFLGRVLGKALYEGILVDVAFAGFFLAKWLGRQSYLDDLASLDPELYKGLIALRNYPGDPEELSLNFVVAEEDFGVTRDVELVPNGANIAVTRLNRTEYIQAMCSYKLNTQIAPQSEAFFRGLSDIIDVKWLRMFDQQELQMLIGGAEQPIDVDDLQRNAVTPDGEDNITIKLFWKVVGNLSQPELKALLSFVTSVGRPPLLGFASLNPKFGIRLAGEDQTRLPSASACANLLKLPRYRDEYTLKSKLLQAINSKAGFDLS